MIFKFEVLAYIQMLNDRVGHIIVFLVISHINGLELELFTIFQV